MNEVLESMQREINKLKRQVEAFQSGGYATLNWRYLTTALTSTSYDGDDTVAVGSYTIDTSSVFGCPVGIKAVLVRVSAIWAVASASSYLAVRVTTGGATIDQIVAHTTTTRIKLFTVPCDANGDFAILVNNADATNVTIRIWGYAL